MAKKANYTGIVVVGGLAAAAYFAYTLLTKKSTNSSDLGGGGGSVGDDAKKTDTAVTPMNGQNATNNSITTAADKVADTVNTQRYGTTEGYVSLGTGTPISDIFKQSDALSLDRYGIKLFEGASQPAVIDTYAQMTLAPPDVLGHDYSFYPENMTSLQGAAVVASAPLISGSRMQNNMSAVPVNMSSLNYTPNVTNMSNMNASIKQAVNMTSIPANMSTNKGPVYVPPPTTTPRRSSGGSLTPSPNYTPNKSTAQGGTSFYGYKAPEKKR